jgi:hypothetical protein
MRALAVVSMATYLMPRIAVNVAKP